MRNLEAAPFLSDASVTALLGRAAAPSRAEVDRILDKAALAKGLEPEEAAVLLMTDDSALDDRLFATALHVKQCIYGDRIVLFAPLYVSNYCINNCRYCGYRAANRIPRRRLTQEEVAEEAQALLRLGHKRIALEAGEDPMRCDLEYVLDCIRTVYSIRSGKNAIRRINVNIAAASVEQYRRLKAMEIGTYLLFQETYHRETYAHMHPSGPKRDYDWHTGALARAQSAGIDDVGAGVLFGLYDYRFEALALLLHARHLEAHFGCGPHTISVPRLRPAEGVSLTDYPHLVSDHQFKRLVAILRLAVPYAGLILTTRETPALRAEVLRLGVSQISAGSCTGVGGYREAELGTAPDVPQFETGDHRSPDEVVRWLCGEGYLPSYCTACYREGRTGDRFMRLAKNGQIQNLCQSNALMTFQEYLEDHASTATRAIGASTVAAHLGKIPNPAARAACKERLERIRAGERQLQF